MQVTPNSDSLPYTTSKRKRVTYQSHNFKHKTTVMLSIVLGVAVTVIMQMGLLSSNEQVEINFFHIVINLILNILIFYLLFLYSFSIARQNWTTSRRVIFGVGGVLIIVALMIGFTIFFHHNISNIFINRNRDDFIIVSNIVMGGLVIGTTFWLISITKRQRLLLENQQLSEENVRMRYDSLKSQVDPHFLFNSLNTLDGLIGFEDEKAHKYVQQLSQTYRYIMQRHNIVTLQEEITFTESYIYLIKIRYGDNLSIESNINPALMQRKVVPLCVQMLIENAIKHNTISTKRPLTISITSPDNDSIEIRNNLQPKNEESLGQGLGLANLEERCKITCGKSIIIRKDDAHFSVTIPLIKE